MIYRTVAVIASDQADVTFDEQIRVSIWKQLEFQFFNFWKWSITG